MSEKSIPRPREALVRRAKNEPLGPRSLVWGCSGDKLFVSGVGGAYDARDRGPNRKFGLVRVPPIGSGTRWNQGNCDHRSYMPSKLAPSGLRPHRWRGADVGCGRRLAIFADSNWTEWLPTYAWVIEHPEGVIVVDTGQGLHLLESNKSLHPYIRWETAFRIDREEEIGPQLRAPLGIGPRDVKRVVATHLHIDHNGGVAHFPHSEILVAPGELRMASGWAGCFRGYVPNRWPSWFDPKPLDFAPEAFGPFAATQAIDESGRRCRSRHARSHGQPPLDHR